MRFPPRPPALSFLFLVLAALQPPDVATAQQLVAAYVHGDAVQKPSVVRLEPAGTGPPCLWFYTYSYHESAPGGAPPAGAMVTLSFFTRAAWDLQSRPIGAGTQNILLSLATFHTRLVLPPTGEAPYLQFRQAAGMGRFTPRGRLTLAGEYYLAGLQIPTRIDSEGRPALREFSASEEAEARGAIPSNWPCALPVGSR
jgi:hypothetical protein